MYVTGFKSLFKFFNGNEKHAAAEKTEIRDYGHVLGGALGDIGIGGANNSNKISLTFM